jgi:hypothetical protein
LGTKSKERKQLLKNKKLMLFTMLFVVLFQTFSVSDAFAYIDPGSGSVVIQMIIGALVGAGIAIKVYWEKLKMKLTSFGKKDE